ncbi:iron-siderophore ABC transporter substrate-binding protein [Plantactinospora solaniradicis]|uniref:Iron-siderophore ABC transporter substrate-binding protein n=1 Tax=Plantactinospora solaniradicis TaxID=1723736 RepID=A0ABW1K4J4_9ACTN
MRPRFRVTGLLTAALLALAATACGGPADEAGGAPSGTPDAAAFPVDITHKYGTTTIKAEPKRVVTVGLVEQDALLALGVVPVATTEWLGGFPGAIGPWAKDRLGGAALPQVLQDTGDGPQFEKIAALAPDLILALYSGLDQKQYDTLSKIAPTVAQPKEHVDYGVPWDVLTRTVGKAVGRSAQAEQVVGETMARFAKVRQENPRFVGAEAVLATTYEGYFVYGTQDIRTRVMAELGFASPPDLDKVIGDKFGANISAERAELFDADVAVWLTTDPIAERAKLHKAPVYGGLDVVKQGRELYVDENTTYGQGISFVTVLSLPYVLDRLVPQLTAALDGNPATEVAQPAAG